MLIVVCGCKTPTQRLTEMRQKYPCPQTGKVDSFTTIITDSVPVYVQGERIEVKADCPASPTPSVKTVFVDVPGKTVYLPSEKKITIRKEYFEDASRIDSMQFVVNRADLAQKVVTYEKDKTITALDKKVSAWRMAALISWMLILLAGIGIGVTIKKIKL